MDAKATGPFVIHKVARLYIQCMIIEEPDGPRGQERQLQAHTIYAINLALFDNPYVEPQEITLEAREEVPKPAQVLEKCRKSQGRCMSWPWLFL